MRILYSLFLLFFFNTAFADPIIFGYYYEGNLIGDEHISINFPSPPALVQSSGSNVYVAKDEEGTEFTLSAFQVPHSDYDVSEAIQSLIASVEESKTKTLISAINGVIVWSENNKITQLMIIPSNYFIYFLTTTSGIQDEEKARAFANSFLVTAEFTLA